MSMPIGSSPENGSSRTSTSGEWTSAAASCTRCWLPSDSFEILSVARSARPSRSSHSVAALASLLLRQPVQAAQVDEVIDRRHVRVQTALLGEVAEPSAVRRRDVRDRSIARVPRSGEQHTHHDAHRRRLPGAVRAEQTEDLAGRDRDGQLVERDDVPVALRQPVELEHLSSSSTPDAASGSVRNSAYTP